MAIFVQIRAGRAQVRVTHKLLPKPFFHTFDTEVEANAYGNQLQALLDRGIVPQELLATKGGPASPLLIEVIRAYTTDPNNRVAESDQPLLTLLVKEAPGLRMNGITFPWVNAQISAYKQKEMAPGTIRKRIGALSKVVAWHIRSTTPDGEQPAANVLTMLPRGYSQYADGKVKDVQRDVRLAPDDEAKVRRTLGGHKRDDRERAWGEDPELEFFFSLILETGLRLREAYTLDVRQLDVARGVLNINGTKGHHGAKKPRTVPLKRELRARVIAWCEGKTGLMFSFWDGTPEDLKKCSARLSARFASLFEYSGVEDMKEHDLRHEACCRWVTLKDSTGRWMFNEVEICKIMGWSSIAMLLRYASLRGEDLADRLI